MRPIKFKAIDKYTKEIHPNPFNGKINGINDIFSNTGDWIFYKFINVMDSNGHEVYEGDIVKIMSNPIFIGEVIERFGAFGVEFDGHGKYFIDINDKFEVVGHSMLNPEILINIKQSR